MPPVAIHGGGAAVVDLTVDFRAAVERAARAAQASTSAPTTAAAATPATGPASSAPLATAGAAAAGQSEFARRAAAIGAGIHSTSGRLAALAALARRTATFDDPAAEVAELSARVKRDIHSLNAALSELQALAGNGGGGAAAPSPASTSTHAAAHSKAVVDSLRGRLKDAASEFRDVLGARQAALAAHAGRRELFSAAPGTGGGGGGGVRPPAAAAAPPPHPPSASPPVGSTSPSVLTHRGHGPATGVGPATSSARPLFGGSAAPGAGTTASAAGARAPLFAGRAQPGAAAGAAPSSAPSETCVPAQQAHPLRQRRVGAGPGFGGDGSHPFLPPPPGSLAAQAQAQAQALAQAHAPDAYLSARAGALAQVESTITELGGIFTQLASLVAEQGEVALRIDEHVSEALGHVDGAQAQLLRHLATISSNRWLVMKCLAVLLAFALFFIFVVA